jgi:hypothetical protein
MGQRTSRVSVVAPEGSGTPRACSAADAILSRRLACRALVLAVAGDTGPGASASLRQLAVGNSVAVRLALTRLRSSGHPSRRSPVRERAAAALRLALRPVSPGPEDDAACS